MDKRDISSAEIPVTWSELILQHREPLFMGLDRLLTIPQDIADAEPDPLFSEPVSDALLGASGMLAQGALVYGPRSVARYCDAIAPLLSAAFDELGDGATVDTRVNAQSLLSLVNTLQCSGIALSADVLERAIVAQSTWPRALLGFTTRMSEPERYTLALSGLIAGDIDTSVRALDNVPLGDTFVAAQQFDFNVNGFIRYLASALHAKAPMPAVLPALLNFIERFPHKVAAGQLRWDDLLYATRIVVHQIGGEPVEQVASAGYALISELSLRAS